ncbi:MAG: cell division protein FtsQ/DivIB [Rhizobiaceae bacterium]
MFALKSAFWGGKVRRGAQMPVEIGKPGHAVAHDGRRGIVLPRVLRRPARLAGRLIQDGADTPRHAAMIMSLALLTSFAAYGAVLGGHMPSIVQAVTARTGFAVEEIRISGHKQTSEIDIIGQLDLGGWTSLLTFSAAAARDRLAALPWVDNVSVRKAYPSTLEIRIDERKPFAIWQNGSALTLVEKSGASIVAFPGGDFASLPLVVGLGAPEHAAGIVARVAAEPDLARHVKAFIRVADRRWDLRLDNGITVKLPETGDEEAMADLVALDRSQGILSRDVASIDMRLGDRLTVRLTPDAVKHREAALKEREKRRRKDSKI